MHTRTLILRFPREIVDKPIIYNLVRDYSLDFNILKAQIFPRKEGMLVMELRGSDDDFEKGVTYLEQVGVQVEPVGQGIHRDEEIATSAAPVRLFALPGHSTLKDPRWKSNLIPTGAAPASCA